MASSHRAWDWAPGRRGPPSRPVSTPQLPLRFSHSGSPPVAAGTQAPDAPPSGSAKTPGGAPASALRPRRFNLAKVAVPAPQPSPPPYGPCCKPRRGLWGCLGAGARGPTSPTLKPSLQPLQLQWLGSPLCPSFPTHTSQVTWQAPPAAPSHPTPTSHPLPSQGLPPARELWK